jgi:hypothetical protein
MHSRLRRAHERFRRYLMHNGVVDAAFHIAYRLANSVVTMLVLQILILERSDMDWSLVASWDDRWRFLCLDELVRFAEQDPSLELDAGFLSAAFGRGG